MSAAALLLLVAIAGAAEWVAVDVTATAYCPCKICCGLRGVGITANGTDTRTTPYGIAADPDRIPYGSTIWIPTGEGYLDKSRPDDDARQFTVDDTGGIIRRRTRQTGRVHLDLRFIQHRNAERFGVRRMTVYLWKD